MIMMKDCIIAVLSALLLGVIYIFERRMQMNNEYFQEVNKQLEIRLTERIDTGPKKVSFSAYINNMLENLPENTVIPFDTVAINEGNGFSVDGVFTVPKPGVYIFLWNINNLHGGRAEVALYINDVIARWTDVYGWGRQNGSGQYICRLQNGDKVWIATYRHGSSIHPHHTTFNGFMIN